MKRLLLILALAVLPVVVHAQGVEDVSGGLNGPTIVAAPTQPGTIDSAGTFRYGPIACFGARAVVFYITTTDNDSLAAASIETSDDNLKYYAACGNVDCAIALTHNLVNKQINGRVSRLTVLPAPDGSTNGGWVTFFTDRFMKLKLTANGAAIAGVSVRPVVIYGEIRSADDVRNVYDWSLPSD